MYLFIPHQFDELVFARTSPQQKLQIVRAFQGDGCTVAVTGDGGELHAICKRLPQFNIPCQSTMRPLSSRLTLVLQLQAGLKLPWQVPRICLFTYAILTSVSYPTGSRRPGSS